MISVPKNSAAENANASKARIGAVTIPTAYKTSGTTLQSIIKICHIM